MVHRHHDREVTMKDALTRRECLRIGVTAGLGSAFLPTLSSLSGADATAATAASEEKGIPEPYLEAGLAALANAWRSGWANGHYGAAVIAAYFFAREVELDERTRAALQTELDAFRIQGRQFFEFETPKEEATPDRVPEIARSLEVGIDQLRGAGHDVIFAALALKAFHHAPALAKPQWIDGILGLDQHLREHFRPDADTAFNRAHPMPKWQTPQEMLESALGCFVRSSGTGGAVGLIHDVTHADAVAELWELGYESLAMRGSEALKIHINLDPSPAQPGGALAEPLPDSPLSHRFWDNPAVRRQTWGFHGHNFKFPYSYYRRRGAIRDADLRKKCDDRALSVIATVIS